MSLLNTQLQNVNVKTLQLRHFCISHFPAFNLYLVTTSQDIFEEDSIPFNQFGFCITTATFKQRLGWFLSVGDCEFQFEFDELNTLCTFLNVKAPIVEA